MRARLVAAIGDLADEPRPAGATKLVGEQSARRIRVGDHRVVYDVLDGALVVTVVRVEHSREVYDRWALASRSGPSTAMVWQRGLDELAQRQTA